jgi:hypothetical protein
VLWTAAAIAIAVLLAALVSVATPMGVLWGRTAPYGVAIHHIGFARGQLEWGRRAFSGPASPGVPPRLYIEFGATKAWTPPPGYALAASSHTRSPAWLLLFVLALPLAALVRAELAVVKRARQGQCRECGYDLRGVPVVDGRRTCPECGTTRRWAGTHQP